jgi:hypothetical protein
MGGIHFYASLGVQAPNELQVLRACCLIKARFEQANFEFLI